MGGDKSSWIDWIKGKIADLAAPADYVERKAYSTKTCQTLADANIALDDKLGNVSEELRKQLKIRFIGRGLAKEKIDEISLELLLEENNKFSEETDRVIRMQRKAISETRKEAAQVKDEFSAYRREKEREIGGMIPDYVIKDFLKEIYQPFLLLNRVNEHYRIKGYSHGSNTALGAITETRGLFYSMIFSKREDYDQFKEKIQDTAQQGKRNFEYEISIKYNDVENIIKTENVVIYGKDKKIDWIIVKIDKAKYLARILNKFRQTVEDILPSDNSSEPVPERANI